MKKIPTWYTQSDDLTATIDLAVVGRGIFPIREPSTNAFATLARLLKGDPSLYDPAILAQVMIVYYDDSGGGDWPAKNAKLDDWKKCAAELPKTAADRIAEGCLVHFNGRHSDAEGNG